MRVVAALGLVAASTCAAASAGVPAGPSACAVAWNHGAPAKLRAAIAAQRPSGAFVTDDVNVYSMTWTKHAVSTSTGAPGCGIQFILRDGRTLSVSGAWKTGGIRTWVGPVRSNRPLPVPDNSTVRPDGTLGFHG